MTSNRDAYELAELLESTTGRAAMDLVRWAARRARSTYPAPVYRQLERLAHEFPAGYIPDDLPAPITIRPSTTPILLYNIESEEENWL